MNYRLLFLVIFTSYFSAYSDSMLEDLSHVTLPVENSCLYDTQIDWREARVRYSNFMDYLPQCDTNTTRKLLVHWETRLEQTTPINVGCSDKEVMQLERENMLHIISALFAGSFLLDSISNFTNLKVPDDMKLTHGELVDEINLYYEKLVRQTLRLEILRHPSKKKNSFGIVEDSIESALEDLKQMVEELHSKTVEYSLSSQMANWLEEGWKD